tara:strand:+ start:667 stop:846 length:180 start_codon:yes stop_codon:yes gene_type:complete
MVVAVMVAKLESAVTAAVVTDVVLILKTVAEIKINLIFLLFLTFTSNKVQPLSLFIRNS